jgi:hypothetical protein
MNWNQLDANAKAHLAQVAAYGVKPTNTLFPITGEMFNAKWERCDALLVTTNAHKRTDHSIVMGRGAAKQLALLVDGIDVDFGRQIEHLKPYGIVWSKYELSEDGWGGMDVPYLGAFQVKRSFKDKASLDLIERSCVMLDKWCRAHPKAKVRLNYPGIGNGGLSEDEVRPILEECLNLKQVSIWKCPPVEEPVSD